MPFMRAMLSTAAAVICLFAAPASALPISADYTSLSVFGDSLSDPGNSTAFRPGAPSPFGAYFDGRHSNGPVWAEALTADFAPGAARNFARGGGKAISGPDRDPADLVLDLPAQRAAFDAAVSGGGLTLGARPLTAIWLGTNDGPRVPAATRIAEEIADLSADHGILDFLVLDLPDLGRWPVFSAFAAGTTASSAAFNATLSTALDALEAADPLLNLVRLSMEDFFDALLDDPAGFGFANGAAPCRASFDTRVFCDDPETRVFYDPIHPTAAVHDLIAGEARLALSLANQPAAEQPAAAPLMALAAAALGLFARRRRAAAAA